MTQKLRGRADVLMAFTVGPVFLLLAVLLVLHSRPTPLPVPSLAEVRAEDERVALGAQLSIQPLRQPQTAPPAVLVNGYVRDCQDCHRVFTSHDDTPRQLRQHQGIQVDHGINDRCFNCHHVTDRNMLTLRDGSPVPYDREEELCSQCHGTTFRDWQAGMHGKTLGYWSTALGAPQRLVCTACHDPHRPAFSRFAPAPGPHTFRMGTQHGFAEGSAAVERNPLRTWSRRADHEQPREGR